MDAKYKITGGQQGAVGDYATASNFNQLWESKGADIDLSKLAIELDSLKKGLILHAKEPEHYVAIAEVAEAEKSAKEGVGSKALEHIKRAGAWIWDIATKVGIGIATAAAKSALGL